MLCWYNPPDLGANNLRLLDFLFRVHQERSGIISGLVAEFDVCFLSEYDPETLERVQQGLIKGYFQDLARLEKTFSRSSHEHETAAAGWLHAQIDSGGSRAVEEGLSLAGRR